MFRPDFLSFLREVRFTGSVRAVPEGRLFFADEPVLEITAPIIEAQMAETYVINQMNLQTALATKAARCVWAAQGRGIADFASRRTQGSDAAMKMAPRQLRRRVHVHQQCPRRQPLRYPAPPEPWPTPSYPAFPRKWKHSAPTPNTSPTGRCCCWTLTTLLPGLGTPSLSPRNWRQRETT